MTRMPRTKEKEVVDRLWEKGKGRNQQIQVGRIPPMYWYKSLDSNPGVTQFIETKI